MSEAGRVEGISHAATNKLPPVHQLRNDDVHLDPSRWWFASAAFPMIAGTLGPVASAFSICALVQQWRQPLPPGEVMQNASFHHDPPWLTIVNAIQLAVAIISNIFLLLNMARRVRFTVAQPITILGWYISTICLVALNVTAATALKNDPQSVDEYIWSQAFYYGIWAAILYFVDASLMTITFWGASSGHYNKDFVLAPSQRTLMLQTILFLMYLLLGALVFSTIEDWNYLDAVYWANVTLFTVGFGDFVVTTTLGRALLFPYALIGVISLGLVISSIRSLILDRGKRRLDARMEEKNRRRMVRAMTQNGNDDIFNPIQEAFNDASPESCQESPPPAELKRRKAEFELMRKIQSQASSRRKWVATVISTGVWLLLWFVGAAVFLECEKPYQTWTYFDAFYFCFVSFTTIGYGDRTPVSNSGKSFFVFWSLLALPTMTVLISNAGETVVKFIRDATIRLGTITILPGDESLKRNMKYIIHYLTRGRVFARTLSRTHDVEAVDEPTDRSMTSFNDLNLDHANGSGLDLHAESQARANRWVPENGDDGTAMPTARASILLLHGALDHVPSGTDFHLLLVSEIQIVTRHLRGGKPRRYTYEEWAWYLRLLGEDERDPGTHRKVRVKPKGGKHTVKQVRGEQGRLKWSWVGVHSPLMDSQEESEWILDKLIAKLKESLTTG